MTPSIPVRICEQCGAKTTVALSSTRVHLHGEAPQPPSRVRHLCRDCATAAGVPLGRVDRARVEPPASATQTWASFAQFLALYESVVGERAAFRDDISGFLQTLPRFTAHLDGPMPADAAAIIDRLRKRASP